MATRTKRDPNLKKYGLIKAVAYGVWKTETDELAVYPTWDAGMDALVATRCRGDYCNYSPSACCVLVLVDGEGWIVNESMNQPVRPVRPY
jgi:hypothetical protein